MINSCTIHTKPIPKQSRKAYDEPCAGWIQDECCHENVRYLPIYCNKWRCPRCGPLKRTAARARVAHAARVAEKDGRFLRFVTLTYAQDIPLERLYHDLQHLAQSLRRHLGRFEYARFVERTQRGRFHMHLVVLSPFLAVRQLSQMWRTASHGSYIVHVRAIASPKIASAYITKYLTKDPTAKVTFSRNFPNGLPPKDKDAIARMKQGHRYVFWPLLAINDLDCHHYDRNPGTPKYRNGLCACWRIPIVDWQPPPETAEPRFTLTAA